MSNELHHPSDHIEVKPGASLTLEATLGDGTSINLTVSPASTASSAVTASTTFTPTFLSFEINTSLPNQSLTPQFSPSPANSPSDRHPKPTSARPPKDKNKGPSKMSASTDLPEDVVAIDNGDKSYLFYVGTDARKNNRLSYLESPGSKGDGNYKLQRIMNAKNLKDEDESIIVSSKNKQIAAVTWAGKKKEIRVYYVDSRAEHLREICKTGDGPWKMGALGYASNTKIKALPNTSISASALVKDDGTLNLRVFAAQDGQENDDGITQISIFKLASAPNASGTAKWESDYITGDINAY